MIKLITILLTSLSFNTTVMANFSYELILKPNGQFEIYTTQTYSKQKEISDLVYDLFFDESKQLNASPSLVAQTVNLNYSQKINQRGVHQYRHTSSARKNNMAATMENQCSLKVDESIITNECKLIKASTVITSKLFKYASSKLDCKKSISSQICQTSLIGQTEAINLLLTSRTADRLAISGAVESLRTLFNLYHLVTNERMPLSSNNFQELNLTPLWDDLISKLNRHEKLDRGLKIISAPNGYTISPI
jgi:hypothetical protein